MSESGNHMLKSIYAAREISIIVGVPMDAVEPPGTRELSDLAAMIGLLHPGAFTLPAGSHWFLVYAEDGLGPMLGYAEIIEEAGAKWSYGHIHITDPDAAKAVFGRVREAASAIGRAIDDLHPDHTWYVHQRGGA